MTTAALEPGAIQAESTAPPDPYLSVARVIGWPGTWFVPETLAFHETAMLNHLVAMRITYKAESLPDGFWCTLDGKVRRSGRTRQEAMARAIVALNCGEL